MESQNKESLTDKMMNFIIKIFVKCTPTREDFKTQPTKVIFKVILLIIGILMSLLFIVGLFGIYILVSFLMLFSKILSFGALADKKYQKSQDEHYDERGRYY